MALDRRTDWELGRVQPHGNDAFAFLVGTERSFFKSSHDNTLDASDVPRLRGLLYQAGLNPATGKSDTLLRIVVIIDHRAARVYGSLGTDQPESEQSIKPYDPHGFHQHLIHRKEAYYQGERAPEESSFYESVAKDLVKADEIVPVGHGTGKSSTVEFLAAYLKKHHPETSDRMIAIETVDLSALTDPQIEEIVKKHFL